MNGKVVWGGFFGLLIALIAAGDVLMEHNVPMWVQFLFAAGAMFTLYKAALFSDELIEAQPSEPHDPNTSG